MGLMSDIGSGVKSFADTTAKNSQATASGSGDPTKKYRNKPSPAPTIDDSYHKGGRVKRTGPARLKRGERVLTKKQARKYDRKRGSKS